MVHLRLILSVAFAAAASSSLHQASQNGTPTAGQSASQPAASQGHATAEYTGCATRAGANTVQQGMCAQAELTRQDARLNAAYKALLRSFATVAHPPEFNGTGPVPAETDRQRTLREEERAWLADRDQVCRLNHDTVDNVCLIERESARADELEARLRRQP